MAGMLKGSVDQSSRYTGKNTGDACFAAPGTEVRALSVTVTGYGRVHQYEEETSSDNTLRKQDRFNRKKAADTCLASAVIFLFDFLPVIFPCYLLKSNVLNMAGKKMIRQ